MDWFSLALICAFSLATADAFTKKWLTDYSGGELLLLRMAFSALWLLPVVMWNPWPQVAVEL